MPRNMPLQQPLTHTSAQCVAAIAVSSLLPPPLLFEWGFCIGQPILNSLCSQEGAWCPALPVFTSPVHNHTHGVQGIKLQASFTQSTHIPKVQDLFLFQTSYTTGTRTNQVNGDTDISMDTEGIPLAEAKTMCLFSPTSQFMLHGELPQQSLSSQLTFWTGQSLHQYTPVKLWSLLSVYLLCRN